MHLPVKSVIYFYIFVCVVLLLFNALYIFRSESSERKQRRRSRHWENYLAGFTERETSMYDSDKLFRQLRKIRELIAFREAMECQDQKQPGTAVAFCQKYPGLFLKLADAYGKRGAVEKAFFAYVIADFYPAIGDQHNQLLEHLLRYLEDSTVFSRENVLNALYALGNTQAVEHGFVLMSQKGWYHDLRLLSDGLNQFQGDKTMLANRLWNQRSQLIECYQVGVIRFADSLEGDSLAELFLRAMETENLFTETRFTLVRYFRRHVFPAAKPMLLRLLKAEEDGNRELAIAAASVLSSYPDDETRQALKTAIHSFNWYVRQNSARSLKAMGVTWEEAREAAGEDHYAVEMLEYVFEVQSGASESSERK